MSEERKQLTFFDLFTLGLGGAIGSGIFVLLSAGIGYTGRSIVVAVLGGCLIMLLAYFYNVLLSSMFVFRGGDYGQKAFLFGPYATGVSAMFSMIGGFGIALYGLAMVEYAGIIFPLILPYKRLIGVLVITLFFGATTRGAKFLSKINNVMTVILLTAIVAFIAFGLPQVKSGFFTGEDFLLNGPVGLFSAIPIMGWACQGTTMGPISVSSFTKNPKRLIPLAILVITLSLAVIYGLMSMVASGVLPLGELEGQNLSSVSSQIFPSWVHILFILGGGVFAIATSLVTAITMLGEPIQQIAEDGWLPKVFLKRTAGGFPWVTRLLFYSLGVVPIILNFSLESIVSLIMVPTMLLNCYLNLKCMETVKSHPRQWQKSVLHMPKILLNGVCLLACGSNLFVAYYLFIELDVKTMVTIVGIIGVCLAGAFIQLKRGAVKPAILMAQREQIVREALEGDEGEVVA